MPSAVFLLRKEDNATFWTGFDIGVALGSVLWGMVAAAMGYKFMFNLTIIPLVLALAVYFFRIQGSSLRSSPKMCYPVIFK